MTVKVFNGSRAEMEEEEALQVSCVSIKMRDQEEGINKGFLSDSQ